MSFISKLEARIWDKRTNGQTQWRTDKTRNAAYYNK